MSRSLNKAVLIGNVGADPEVRTARSGSRFASFSLATGSRWTDERGVDRGRTDWHTVIVWEKLADAVSRAVRKGDRVYVEGRLEYRSWESAGGRRRYATEIIAEELLFLETPAGLVQPVFVGDDATPAVARDVESKSVRSPRAHDDELPF